MKASMLAPPSPLLPSAPFRLAVLITCHNRRDTTLRCLEALFAQEGLPSDLQIEVYLVDDGSTDGTGEAVRTRFPQVRVLPGDGNLYWAGGMRLAWDTAFRTDPDAYLWLNDDTHVYSDALLRLWQCQAHPQGPEPVIWVGSTRDPETGHLTYGGHRRISRLNLLKTAHLSPEATPIRCDTFNGNCVWINRSAYNRLGTFPTWFKHAGADTDYGFRAKRQGIPIWVMPGYVGTCCPNLRGCPWLQPGISMQKRWEILVGPKGLPAGMYIRLALRHGGWLGPVIAIKPYLGLFLINLNPIKLKPH